MKKTVAIHQPNFLPWLGYFHKISHCDVFVILDNVQLSKTGGSYVNRVQIAVANEPKWITVPIVRSYHGHKIISEIEINYSEPWKEKLLRTLQTYYGRANFFEPTYKFLGEILARNPRFIAEWNIEMINSILEHLELKMPSIVNASTVSTNTTSTNRLVELTLALGGTTYLSGGGADGYQDKELFKQAGIELTFQEYRQATYPQIGDRFIPGLSIVDAIMNLGWKGTKELIE